MQIPFLTFAIIDSHARKSKSRKDNQDAHGTMLSEDYAEIVDDEGDYSTPAGKYCFHS